MSYSSGNSSDGELSDSSDNQEYYTHERLDQKLSELKNVLSSTDLDNDESFDPNVAANLIKKYKDNFEDIVSPSNSLLFNYPSPDTSIDLSDSDSIDLGQSPISPNPIPEPEPPPSHLPSTFVVQDEILLEADIPRQIIPQNTINISINPPQPPHPPQPPLQPPPPPFKPDLVSELQPITVFQSEIKEPVVNEELSPLPPPSDIPFLSSKITLPFNFLIDSRCGKSYLSVKDINELDGEIEEYIPPSELDLDSSDNNINGRKRGKNDIIYPMSYPWADNPADFHTLKREMDQITQEIENIQTNIESGLNDMKKFDVKQDRLYNYMHNTKGSTFIPYTFNSRQIPPPPPPPEDEYITEYNKITQKPKNIPEPRTIQPLQSGNSRKREEEEGEEEEELGSNELYDNRMIKSEYEAENELQSAKNLLGLLKREIRPRVSMNNVRSSSTSAYNNNNNNNNNRKSVRNSQRRSISSYKLQNLKERQSMKQQQQQNQQKPPLIPYQDVIQISQSQRQPHIIGKSPSKIRQINNNNNNNTPSKQQTKKVITNNYIYVDPRRSVPLLPRPRKKTQPVIIYKPKEK